MVSMITQTYIGEKESRGKEYKVIIDAYKLDWPR